MGKHKLYYIFLWGRFKKTAQRHQYMLFNNIKEHTTYKPLELHKGKKVDLHFHTIQLLQFSVFTSSFAPTG